MPTVSHSIKVWEHYIIPGDHLIQVLPLLLVVLDDVGEALPQICIHLTKEYNPPGPGRREGRMP